MTKTKTLPVEGTPEQLAETLGKLSNTKRYRLVEVDESRAAAEPKVPLPDPRNAASIALLESWIAEAPATPESVRAAEEELQEFQRNLNQLRKEAGARPLYPDAE